MAMARSFKLFQILLLVFAWQCCEKAGAAYGDMTGAANPEASKEFSFRSFTSHGVGTPSADGGSSSSNSLSPAPAPAVASWVGASVNGNGRDVSFAVGTPTTRNRDGTVTDGGNRAHLDYGFKTK